MVSVYHNLPTLLEESVQQILIKYDSFRQNIEIRAYEREARDALFSKNRDRSLPLQHRKIFIGTCRHFPLFDFDGVDIFSFNQQQINFLSIDIPVIEKIDRFPGMDPVFYRFCDHIGFQDLIFQISFDMHKASSFSYNLPQLDIF